MTLRDLLRRRDKIQAESTSGDVEPAQFTILRSDTNTAEVLETSQLDYVPPEQSKRRSRFRSLSSASGTSKDPKEKSERRLSTLLHIRSPSHDSKAGSANVPSNLPDINSRALEKDDEEAQWEKRATLLARENGNMKQLNHPRRPTMSRQISDAKGDDDIQRAIRLHEQGDLEQSTAMFGRLADPEGQNIALAQVLYGLALRHGWGIEADPSKAIAYLSEAASNSASVESQALDSGLKKGGAAKGELVLAIFELANCFRNGWGVEKDAVAARKYYETAANLGDVDSMLEAGRCYEDGFGGKKDKFLAAKYYRLAEQAGHNGVGNSWIWKDKYNQEN